MPICSPKYSMLLALLLKVKALVMVLPIVVWQENSFPNVMPKVMSKVMLLPMMPVVMFFPTWCFFLVTAIPFENFLQFFSQLNFRGASESDINRVVCESALSCPLLMAQWRSLLSSGSYLHETSWSVYGLHGALQSTPTKSRWSKTISACCTRVL